ncbi:MAG: sensor domain-containing protein [Armatimonadota bacterium]
MQHSDWHFDFLRMYDHWFIILSAVCILLMYVAHARKNSRQASARIAASERLYRNLVEGSPNIISFSDHDGRCTCINEAGLNGLAMTDAEVLGHKFSDIWPDEIRPVVENAVQLVMLGERCSFESNYVRPDGDIRTYYVVLNPVMGQSGVPIGFAGIWTNLTEAKQIEEKLLRSQTELFAVFNNAPVIMVLVDSERRVQQANHAAIQFANRDAEEILGLKGGSAFYCAHSKDVPEGCGQGPSCSKCIIRSTVTQTVQTGKGQQRVEGKYFTNRLGKRMEMDVLVSTAIVEVENQQLVLLCIEDITDRKKAEAALSIEQQRLATTLRSIGDAVIATDTESRVTLLNAVAEELTGWSEQEGIGKPVADVLRIFNEKTRKSCPNPVTNALATGSIVGMEEDTALLSKDGREISIADSCAPIRDELGNVIGAVLVFRDITQQKQAERALQESEEQKAAILDGLKDIMVEYVDADMRILWSNNGMGSMLGQNPEDLVGRYCYEVVQGLTSPCPDCTAVKAFETGEFQQGEVTLPDGSNMVVHSNPIKNPEGTVTGVVLVGMDITERRKSEDVLRMQTSAMNAASDQIVITDIDGNIEFVNPAFVRETGYTLDEVRGKNTRILSSGKHDHEFYADLWETIRAGNTWHGEITNRRKDGAICVEDVSITPVKGDDGLIKHYVAIKRDVTDKKVYEEQLDYLAYHDPLTGLPNRLMFSDRLTQTLARSRQKDELLAIMFLDLDRFKFINDSLGHNVGDLLLKAVAERLTQTLRKVDTLARMGGDEFTVIVSDVSGLDDAMLAAERIVTALSEPFLIENHELFVSTSIGVSLYPSDGRNAETLVKNADTAMYRAKEQGRNNYQFYTESLNVAAVEKMTLEVSLRKALERNEFTLHYQPQVDMRTGKILAAEALIRWSHPHLGTVSPGQFIPLAEETGLILPISEWVIRTACAQNKAWQDAGLPPITMAVNVSARLFQGGDLMAMVNEALRKTKLLAGHLELELTESALMQNPDLAVAVLGGLKATGVKVSLDDFGTGYSSLSYLKRFPIDTVKIDQSFVKDITSNPDDAAIAGAVVAMAHSLKLTVAAEGVETLEQLQFLRSLKCDRMQGYFVSRPVPADDFTEMLHESWDDNSRLAA